MTRFHFERPDGPPSNSAQNILIHLNEFIEPQGYGGGAGIPPITGDFEAYDTGISSGDVAYDTGISSGLVEVST